MRSYTNNGRADIMEVSTQQFWENFSFELLEQYKYLQVAPNLTSIERNYCKYISGNTLHLFCNFGVNTFELEKFSDSIVGLDFSESAINYANEYKKVIRSKAKFLCKDFFDFNEGEFDTIYASYGILDWISDLDLFFKQVKANLSKNGKFILVEFDQSFFSTYLNDIGERIDSNTFLVSTKVSKDAPKSLLGGIERTTIKSRVIVHELDTILSSLDSSGFTLDRFDEYDYINFKMTDYDIQLDTKAFRHSKLPIDANMCYGLVASL